MSEHNFIKNPFVIAFLVAAVFVFIWVFSVITINVIDNQVESCQAACTLGSTTCLNECVDAVENVKEELAGGFFKKFNLPLQTGLMWMVIIFILVAALAFIFKLARK